jgi:hypothetical protein
LSAYIEWGELARLVEFTFGKNLDEICSRGKLSDVVFCLIRWAKSRGWLEELVHAADAGGPGGGPAGRLAEGSRA